MRVDVEVAPQVVLVGIVARIVTTRHITTILSQLTTKVASYTLSSSSIYKPDQNDSSPAFAANRTWQPTDMMDHNSLSFPNAPAVYLSSRLSSRGSGQAPITELLVPHHGCGGFTHYSEQLGVAYMQCMMLPEVEGASASTSTHRHPPVNQGSATTHLSTPVTLTCQHVTRK